MTVDRELIYDMIDIINGYEFIIEEIKEHIENEEVLKEFKFLTGESEEEDI